MRAWIRQIGTVAGFKIQTFEGSNPSARTKNYALVANGNLVHLTVLETVLLRVRIPPGAPKTIAVNGKTCYPL